MAVAVGGYRNSGRGIGGLAIAAGSDELATGLDGGIGCLAFAVAATDHLVGL